MLTGLIGWAIKIFGGGVLDKVIDAFTKSDAIRIRGKEIDADTIKHAMTAYVESQKVEATKWSFPWFWLLAAPILLSVGGFFLTLTLYNIFWHSDGIYPQTWTIAAYPGPYQDWAETAFKWIFAPALGATMLRQIIK